MKIRLLFIVPYAAMKPLIEECSAEEADLEISVKIGDLNDGVDIAKKADLHQFDVIVSRGGTAKLIEQSVDIPVIDVRVSGYDSCRIN
ncbi:PrpR N-terminal domain-containing protein [Sporolactobacillus kofuensis]|uniref:PrpR N-terminal domain-containing protein n=1 Tax=Sporolactobacillus kofuensis TaxID=269672 RepID=A0ABW1WED7_9BACL|nr:PrpR N-terminal domain-containing protein [Sporolactobacillus kofuensis]MCO7174829.1 PrpR N-terminal domain-containing protein [Sporolactobacillus kofuensis]